MQDEGDKDRKLIEKENDKIIKATEDQNNKLIKVAVHRIRFGPYAYTRVKIRSDAFFTQNA
uniref:Uncharacterized protein n=1 Tax=Ciona intestinalis TaxID=7719 RepID=H2XWP5_CIOIN